MLEFRAQSTGLEPQLIDATKHILKSELAHNTNMKHSGHAIHMAELYHNMKILLEIIDYSTHKWQISGNQKIRLGMHLGLSQTEGESIE